MHHLDVVPGTLVAHPLAARLPVALGGYALEDVLNVGPSFLIATRHQGRSISSTLLTARHAGSNKSDTFCSEILCAAIRIWEVGVSTVDDDVTTLEQWEESLDPVIYCLAGLDEEHDATGLVKLGNEFLGGVGSNNGLSLGLVVEELIDFGEGAVEGADGEAVICHVENQVLAPYLEISASETVPPREMGHNTHITANPMRPRSALLCSWLATDSSQYGQTDLLRREKYNILESICDAK